MPGDLDVPGTHTNRLHLPVAMAAAGTDDEYTALVAPANLKILAVRWTPNAAVTADGTNFTTLSVRNRKADASGTALPASRSYVATDSVAFVPETITNSATAANLLVAAGDVLTVQRKHSGTGVVVPAGVVEIDFQYR